MADMFDEVAAFLGEMSEAHTSRAVTYAREGAPDAELSASVGRTTFRIDQGYEATARVVSRDYLFSVAALQAAGFGEPQRGDQIRETIGGEVQVYEVMSPGDEPHFRYRDPSMTQVRVHTKRVGGGQ